jgi:hypothetical protein
MSAGKEYLLYFFTYYMFRIYLKTNTEYCYIEGNYKKIVKLNSYWFWVWLR